ncbi:hypothetical protein [Brachybacterium epidermidis]|uniref:hypothetical protein n=1 Tax=Brachybacterium epidermidis TaxID=2781983 RepID=UPI00398EA78D
MPNLLLEFLKGADPTVITVCIIACWMVCKVLQLLLEKVETFILLFGRSSEPARRKVDLLRARHPKA